MSRWLRVALLALAAAGCSTRDPLNPLDPRNPDTHGAPQWLDTRADRGAVHLSWEVPGYRDLAEVRVVDAGADSVLWRGPAGADSLTEAPVPDGVDRRFRIDLALASGTVLGLPEQVATPGPQIAWTLDQGFEAVIGLTPDGRARRWRSGDADAVTLAGDTLNARVLVVDFYSGGARLVDGSGETLWTRTGLSRPVAALRDRGGWWVADPGAGSVLFLDDLGSIAWADTAFNTPVDLAPAGEGAVWVADRAARLFRVVRNVGVTDSVTSLSSPAAVASDGDGGVWASDRDRDALARFGPRGGELARVEKAPGLVALAADPASAGGVWAADRGRSRVVLFDGAGREVVSLAGLDAPSAMAVSPDGSEIWVADSGLGEVVRFRRDGTVITRSRDLSAPTSIAVAFSPAR